MRIGIDIMGGDFAPGVTVSGAIQAQKVLPPDTKLVLIGNKDVFLPLLTAQGASPDQFDIVHAPEVIDMGEHPTKAIVKKPRSSIAMGFQMLKENAIAGFASAGNSGAMMVGAMYSVKTIPGIIRPAAITTLPKENGKVGFLLDVGINADCKHDVLHQFGILGSLFAEHVYKINVPRVGLLNIGEEEEKGSLLAQAAHKIMKDTPQYKFIGNVEGRDLFNDKADVIVSDGFTGNVVLKQAESFYELIRKRGIRDEYFDRFNYENYGGTPVIGLNSTVVIGHGISNETAIKNMILITQETARANLTEKIKNLLA